MYPLSHQLKARLKLAHRYYHEALPEKLPSLLQSQEISISLQLELTEVKALFNYGAHLKELDEKSPLDKEAMTLKSLRSAGHRRLLALLVRARIDAHVTQVDLARRLGRHQSFVSKNREW